MKKAWVVPEVEDVMLSATAFNEPEGTVVDGWYQDHETCEYLPVYSS